MRLLTSLYGSVATSYSCIILAVARYSNLNTGIYRIGNPIYYMKCQLQKCGESSLRTHLDRDISQCWHHWHCFFHDACGRCRFLPQRNWSDFEKNMIGLSRYTYIQHRDSCNDIAQFWSFHDSQSDRPLQWKSQYENILKWSLNSSRNPFDDILSRNYEYQC